MIEGAIQHLVAVVFLKKQRLHLRNMDGKMPFNLDGVKPVIDLTYSLSTGPHLRP